MSGGVAYGQPALLLVIRKPSAPSTQPALPACPPSLPSQPALPACPPALARLCRAAQASTPHSGLACQASPGLASLSEPCPRRPAPPRAAAQPAASRHTGLSFSLRHISSVLEVPGAE